MQIDLRWLRGSMHCHVQGDFEVAVWINVVKNARRKAVELTVLQMIVEIPKQIALANLAMRVYHRTKVCVATAPALLGLFRLVCAEVH